MPKAKTSKRRQFIFSYAYDVPCYADFIVTADTVGEAEKKAEKKAEAALKAGKLVHVVGVAFDNRENHRVFYNAEPDEMDCRGLPTLTQLCQKSKS